VEISIRAEAEDGSLESLLRWLRADPELTGQAEVSPGYRRVSESMGGVLEVINIAVADATAVLSLILTWRGQRAKPAPLVVVVDGRPVTLTDEDAVRQITALAEEAQRRQNHSDAG
jgi:F420-0:gamma-glutamyl ligase